MYQNTEASMEWHFKLLKACCMLNYVTTFWTPKYINYPPGQNTWIRKIAIKMTIHLKRLHQFHILPVPL